MPRQSAEHFPEQTALFELPTKPGTSVEEHLTAMAARNEMTPTPVTTSAEELAERAEKLQDVAGFTVETARRETEPFGTVQEEQRVRDSKARSRQGPRWGRKKDGSVDASKLSVAGKRTADGPPPEVEAQVRRAKGLD